MSGIKEKLIINVVGMVIEKALESVSTEEAKERIDALIDKVEDWVKDTDSKIDDITILPLCKLIRRVADIPDND